MQSPPYLMYWDLDGNEQYAAVVGVERSGIPTSWKKTSPAWLSFAGNVCTAGWGCMTGHSLLALDLTCCPNLTRAAKGKVLVRSSEQHHVSAVKRPSRVRNDAVPLFLGSLSPKC